MTSVPVANAIAAWARSYTVRAPAAVSRNAAGRVASPTYTDRTIRAVVQPSGGRELRQLPEGQREGVSLIAYMLSAPGSADKATATPGELFVVDGHEHQIVRVDPWSELGFGGYWIAYLRRRVS